MLCALQVPGRHFESQTKAKGKISQAEEIEIAVFAESASSD